MNFVLISSSGVPTMPRVFSSSRQGGTPHCMKNDSEAVSIQREKFGKNTMPAGSQSPKATVTMCVVVRGVAVCGVGVGVGAEGAAGADSG